MKASRRTFLAGASSLVLAGLAARPASAATLRVGTPMTAPSWALLQRELFRATTEACEAFFDRFFDEKGYFLHFARWGANDGPDDTIENVNDWPQLYALGAPERIKEMYSLAWEGHLRQFTAAKTVDVEIGRQGMFYKEFHVQNDWQHHSEEMTLFNVQGLSAPDDPLFRARARRFAGLYMGEDPDAPNYDARHRIIRSLLNGSRGPMLRKATPLDWAGDPFDTRGFQLGHGEDSYAEFLKHYEEYTDVVGDHPLNLFATTLALNAYMLDHERKYRDWLLGYVDAWAERAKANGDILPSNIGLDGAIGSAADGHWWGGAYGWGFSPVNPATGKREDRNRVPRTILGFYNAYLLTGDDKYLDTWRRQTDRINAQRRTVDGKVQTPTMYGAQGWYGWRDGLNQANALDIWWFSMRESDRKRAPDHPWVAYLEGRNPDYPEAALRADLAGVQKRAKAQRQDKTTPDTRLADAVLDENPAQVTALLQTMMGALHIARPAWAPSSSSSGGSPLYARLRYFDPDRRRAGVPEDVGALIDRMTAQETAVTLVNLNPVEPRNVVIQAGGYGEHRIRSVAIDGVTREIGGDQMTVQLAPGSGARLVLAMDRYVNPPTLSFPWQR
jgi:hypothetical protein